MYLAAKDGIFAGQDADSGRKLVGVSFVPTGLGSIFGGTYPGLAPWAVVCRRSGLGYARAFYPAISGNTEILSVPCDIRHILPAMIGTTLD